MKHGIFVLLFVTVLFTSCNNDDDSGPNVITVPPRLLAEVATENDEEIREFLETHFYNYEEFAAPPAGFDFKIKIDTIAGANADKTPMMDQVEAIDVKVSSFEHLLSEEETDIPHTLYYLSAREGIGSSPTVADSVFVRYEGLLLDGLSFDASLNNAVWFDLARLQDLTQGFRGFAEGVPNFNAGGTITENGDGTVTVDGYGVGMIIFPSGLGAFEAVSGPIPQYSPLIFNIDLYTINPSDHDNDGIPSILEDLNGNGYLYDDNTDAQSEEDAGLTVRFANFQDADDDGDGVSTRNEISDDNDNIIIPFPDSNNDGTPDYLDPDTN
ncbi:FKBP-type peptidyl-prolyl cis-trans isomerase [Flagellimonas sp. S3867]|uniref:FKBP-type peptidyl-prolyl cis-trans isomerase n=1 Tax=Flagellimonas sp. S3867 TaxID=2768063 RepID=UPI0016870A52|nr:hypothetical protein [Flagellimonas sp. S3867]